MKETRRITIKVEEISSENYRKLTAFLNQNGIKYTDYEVIG